MENKSANLIEFTLDLLKVKFVNSSFNLFKHKELNQRLKQIEQELSLAEAQQKTAESQEKTARLQVELQAAQLEIEKYKVYGDPRKILAMECINFIKDNYENFSEMLDNYIRE